MTTTFDNILDATSDAPIEVARPLKVLMLLTSTAGGVGQHSYLLARHLSRERFDITVSFGPGYPLDEDFAKLSDCRVVHLSTRRSISPLANLRALWQVYRLIARGEFDIIFTAQSIAGFVGRVAGAICGVPVRLHCIHVYASHDEQSAIKRSVYRFLERRLDSLTTHYVAVSEATKRFGVERGLFADDRVQVIHNGMPEPAGTHDSREAIRAQLGIRPDALVIATASRFERQKGLHVLLEAMPRIIRSIPSAQLVLIGEGPLKSELEQQTRQLGLTDHVVFAGWRRDVPRILSAIDLFGLSSLWEAMPLTIVEAMAAGRAVVTTDVGGVREMVVDGINGRVVPPRDATALAHAIVELLGNAELRHRFGRSGRERYREMFTLPRMIKQFDRFMCQAAKQ